MIDFNVSLFILKDIYSQLSIWLILPRVHSEMCMKRIGLDPYFMTCPSVRSFFMSWRIVEYSLSLFLEVISTASPSRCWLLGLPLARSLCSSFRYHELIMIGSLVALRMMFKIAFSSSLLFRSVLDCSTSFISAVLSFEKNSLSEKKLYFISLELCTYGAKLPKKTF